MVSSSPFVGWVISWRLLKIVIFSLLFLYKVHGFVHCALDFFDKWNLLALILCTANT